VKIVMKFQKIGKCYGCKLNFNFVCFIDLILFDGESNCVLRLVFCVIAIKSRKLTPSYLENSLF